MTPGPLMRPPGPGNQIGYQWSPPTRSHRDRNGSSSNTRLMESLPVCELRANNHLAPSRENVATILGLPLSLGQCFGARHPREKHLVYVVGAGSRATHCKKRGSKRAASRRENGQKSFKMPRDRLFWCRFEPIEPPQRRTSFTMWPPTI